MWRGGKTFVGKAADRITDLTRDRQAIFIRNAKCPHHIQPISQPAASADARRVPTTIMKGRVAHLIAMATAVRA